jgi:hypothetical protein
MSAKIQQREHHRFFIEGVAEKILLAEHIELVDPDTFQVSSLLCANLRVLAEEIDLPINLISQSRRQLLLDVGESANDLGRIRQSLLAPFVRQYFTSIKLCKPCQQALLKLRMDLFVLLDKAFESHLNDIAYASLLSPGNILDLASQTDRDPTRYGCARHFPTLLSHMSTIASNVPCVDTRRRLFQMSSGSVQARSVRTHPRGSTSCGCCGD